MIGTLKEIKTEYGNAKVTFNIEPTDELDKLKADTKYTVTVKQYRKKRSLSANDYYWVLAEKISAATSMPLPMTHNYMLDRYGTMMQMDGKPVYVLMLDNEDYLLDSKVHLAATSATEDKKGVTYRWFRLMKGSHEYDTKEMSRLIDGIVESAKQLGIETLTPDELADMKARWGSA